MPSGPAGCVSDSAGTARGEIEAGRPSWVGSAISPPALDTGRRSSYWSRLIFDPMTSQTLPS
jgi:hypothetical protein